MGCLRCGTRARAGARFCGSCGTPVGSARAGMRKTVTVLFADVVAEPVADVEAAVRRLEAVHQRLRAILESHGGTVERSAGDAVMAAFGIPTASDDDARRAAAAALAVVAASRGLPGVQAVRVGINTGEVLAGEGQDDQELAVGDAVVVAARLQQHAGPGEVLLGPDTVRFLGAGARCGTARPVTLRGRSGAVTVQPLESLVEAVSAHPSGPFIGRDSERRLLLAALDRSALGRVCQVVTVLGEAGTGKTRLVREVLAERPAARVLRSACRAWGTRSPWQPLVDVLLAAAGLPAGAPGARVLEVLGRRPELAPALGVLEPVLVGSDVPLTGEHVASVLGRVLSLLAAEQPLVVLLEDAHLADAALLDLVPELVRGLEHEPVVLVVLARPELREVCPDWSLGVRHSVSLTVRPLTPELARRLAQSVLPEPEVVEGVVAAAGGNPLFLTQLATSRAEGSSGGPPTLAAVLASRLDRLPVASRHVLERAAVVGERGRVADLRLLCEGVDLDRELRALARRDLIDVEEGSWSFPSELVREAAASAVPHQERSAAHAARHDPCASTGPSPGRRATPAVFLEDP